MGRKNQYAYIHHLARTLAGQLEIRSEEWWSWVKREALGHMLCERYKSMIAGKIKGWSYETLGRIAACGHPEGDFGEPHLHRTGRPDTDPVSLHEVMPSALPLAHGGQNLLLHIATIAIIAAMVDNILADGRTASAN